MTKRKLLLINGSPRKNKTSYSFARTIKKLVNENNNMCEIIHVIDYFDGKESFDHLKNNIAQSDIVGLVTPLYVDTLPYPVIWFFEKLLAEIEDELRNKCFFAIGQCGFPNTTLCEPLLGSCKCFAEATGMKWLGGLGYGGGAIIDGVFLEHLGKKGQKITSGLEVAVENIIQHQEIPPKAQDLLTVSIPKIFYKPLAAYLNYRVKKMGKRNGIINLEKKYYLE